MPGPSRRKTPPKRAAKKSEPGKEAKRGRPPKLTADEETLRRIENLAKIQCTEDEAAAILGVDQSTLNRFLHKQKKAMALWELGARTGRASLRRMQFKAAEDGNVTMLIWLGKQFLGQKDQQRIDSENRNVNWTISDSPSEAEWADAFVTQH